MRGSARLLFAWGWMVVAGCSTKTLVTPPARTLNDQLLLDQALEQSLANARLPIPADKSVAVEIAGLTADKDFIQAAVVRWLARQGLRVPADKQEDYLLRVRVHAFGTNLNDIFVGIPPVSAGLFPISLPELALYKDQDELAVARFSADLFQRKTGRLLASTPVYEGYSELEDGTLLFVFSRRTSNLDPPAP
ncbi:hypothetical protein [Candidatus Methylocalor cossyra]|uniref:DUF4136 domain-containing protein n=1 Tax=Candidatus Methylocalor cossyra TaxID=3108543 RepID=A0ABM9NFV7_9GAMM